MEQLRADRTPQKELFSPTEYADLEEVVRKAPRPENLDVDLGDCREETRLSLGLRDVMETVYDQLGWSSLPGARRKSANHIVRELVMARLSQPESKRATVEALANQAGITLNLDSVYRSMDYLDAPMIDKVCRMSHEAAEKLLDGPVDVLFYGNCSPRYAARSYCLIMSAAFPSSAIWMASIGLYPSSAIVSR